jgi:flagella basal body P-ring formation protein FlgA
MSLMRTIRRLGLAAALALAAPFGALAQEATVPTPRIVIYPGDIIQGDMLTDVPAADAQGGGGAVIQSRASLIGKMARRTLLPGYAIRAAAIDNPRAVVNGSEVRLIYAENGLTIVTTAAALQDGGIGDLIKVRNVDSGVTVSGVVQADGSVRVSGG